MQALWLENQHVTFCEDLPVPVPPPGEALLKVRLAGICSTDLEMVKGYYPFTGVMGHEFVGEVIKVNTPEGSQHPLLGKRVVGEINAVCGVCKTCRAGRPTHCENRTTLGISNRSGVFAGFTTLPLENLHRVPDSVSDEAAVFTEPLAAALEITEQIKINPTDRVLLIGAGRLGLLIAQVLALTGCDLQVVVRHEFQRQILGEWAIKTLTENEIEERQMDVVVEATGSEAGLNMARRAIRPRGTVVLKSTYKGDVRFNFSSFVVDEITLVGSRCGPFPPALRLLENRQVDPLPLIARRYPLSQAIEALDYAARPGVLKVLLEPADT